MKTETFLNETDIEKDYGSVAETEAQEGTPVVQEEVAPGVPTKEKDVVLTFGGSFNPPHDGHVLALTNAVSYLEEQGFTVSKIVVSPTADKLLGKKLGETAYPLMDRVALSRMAFNDVKNAEVTGDASLEAQNFEGSLRRTQLTDWVQKANPNSTVVAITGVTIRLQALHRSRGPVCMRVPATMKATIISWLSVRRMGTLQLARPESGRTWRKAIRFRMSPRA